MGGHINRDISPQEAKKGKIMPIRVQNDLPAKQMLESENIFVMDEDRASSQEIRPLRIAILNLMPLKEDTELDLLRVLSNFPIQTEISLMKTESHEAKHTSASHLNKFYVGFNAVREERFDGLIITGAPVEKLEYSEVEYWDELCEIMDWSKTHVFSSFHICWGAQAGLYYHYGLQKVRLPQKLFGVFAHEVHHRSEPLVRGFDDYFLIPHSRYTEVPGEAIHACPELTVLAESRRAGVLLCMAKDGRQIFIFGHGEYDRYTLRDEYLRDREKGLCTALPEHYFPDDDPSRDPDLQWRSHSSLLYTNWINYYVYQTTPFDLENIGK